MKAVLVSSTVSNNGGFLEHARAAIADIFKEYDMPRVLVVPFAQFDYDDYVDQKLRPFFESLGAHVDSLHYYENQKQFLETADFDALYVNGGNTFKLLKYLQDNDLMPTIKYLVINKNIVYLSASAGTSIAGPTIKTSNDMPIIWPSSLESLGLVPFQINCHFVSGHLLSDLMIETREERIAEFHRLNDAPVVGLAESNWLDVRDDGAYLRGLAHAPVFLHKSEKMWTLDTPYV